MESNWSALGAGTNGQVTGLGMFGGDLICRRAYSSPANNVAVWDFSSWSPLGGGVSIPVTNFYNGVYEWKNLMVNFILEVILPMRLIREVLALV